MLRSRVRCERTRISERGAVAVEFALVLVPVVMLLFGTISGGLAFYQKTTLTSSVREGARFATTADWKAFGCTSRTSCPAWTSAVERHTIDAAAGDLTAAQVCVVPGETCPSGPSAQPTLPTGSCLVRVRAEKPLPGGFNIGVKMWPVTLVEDSYARYERAC